MWLDAIIIDVMQNITCIHANNNYISNNDTHNDNPNILLYIVMINNDANIKTDDIQELIKV